MNDKCVSCGEYVPEGIQVCGLCQSIGGFVNLQPSVKKPATKIDVHTSICRTLNDIYERKNHDYGDSFAKLRNEIPNSILVRIYDKYSRLKTLLEGKEQLVKDESIDDTLMDLANYCIMELVERKVQNGN